MFSKFTEEARKALIGAKREMSELKHSYVGSEHLLLAILKDKNNSIAKKLKEYGIEYSNFRKEIVKALGIGKEKVEWFLYTPLLKKIIEDAMLESKEDNNEVTLEILFSSLIQEGEGIAIRIILSMNVDLDALIEELSIKGPAKKKSNKKKLLIDEFGFDMNKKAKQNEMDPVIGRNQEIDRLIEILCRRTKNNPLLIGDAGVGKTAIVEELSRRIVMGDVPLQLKGKRIVSVSMSSLVAGTKYRGEFEDRIGKMLKEVEQDTNVIIFIDEMHTLVGAGGAEGAIDASNILKPTLARGKMQIIGATTTDEYKKFIEDDKALARRFQTIMIDEPNKDKTKEILLKLKPIYESFHNVKISNDIINLIVDLSDKYIYNRRQPDKAIDILDEVSAKVSVLEDKKVNQLKSLKEELNHIIDDKNLAIINQAFNDASLLSKKERLLTSKINKLEDKILNNKAPKEVTESLVREIVRTKTLIPVFELNDHNSKNVQKMMIELQKEVIGQQEAIDTLYKISKRIKAGFKESNKPISLLFVGPTGVGKTLLAKKFSQYMIGDNSLITLDMSEYKEEHTISKIIGSPPGYVGYHNKTTILEEIKNKPFSVILVDEIEKAHPSVINLFLQILDEGKIKDASGNVVRFDHNIIIMTSNIGFDKNNIGFNNNPDHINTKLKDILSTEILNRIDNVVTFNHLTKKDILKIINNKLKTAKNNFKERNIDVHITNKVIEEIVDDSHYQDFGARKIDKIIHNKIDDLVIDNLIAGNNKLIIESIH